MPRQIRRQTSYPHLLHLQNSARGRHFGVQPQSTRNGMDDQRVTRSTAIRTKKMLQGEIFASVVDRVCCSVFLHKLSICSATDCDDVFCTAPTSQLKRCQTSATARPNNKNALGRLQASKRSPSQPLVRSEIAMFKRGKTAVRKYESACRPSGAHVVWNQTKKSVHSNAATAKADTYTSGTEAACTKFRTNGFGAILCAGANYAFHTIGRSGLSEALNIQGWSAYSPPRADRARPQLGYLRCTRRKLHCGCRRLLVQHGTCPKRMPRRRCPIKHIRRHM